MINFDAKAMNQNWTLFLDRDGIINERIVGGYVKKSSQFIFRPDFLEAIFRLRSLFGKVCVVTNQQGIGKGLMTDEDVLQVHHYMINELQKRSIMIDGVYVCPHLESDDCSCRKPKTGLALQAKKDFPDIDFHSSLMIGDSASDIFFGKNCGMRTALVSQETNLPLCHPDYQAANLMDIIDLLIKNNL
ncbi:MAG: HAD-IIIA family hydrolase [Prevotellaceae bacterium]|jgi:D-glycero-D-manno-heptose 1,7-bisphosphate phosphatase|nr:HAD-IIIA family hydrolase [Prevotellaceae bacterium]